MFEYPKNQTPMPAANHGIPVEDEPSVKVDKAAVEASKAKEAKVAEAEKKAEDVKENSEPKLEGAEANR